MIALGHYRQIMSNTSQLVNLGITALTSDYEDIFGPFFHGSVGEGNHEWCKAEVGQRSLVSCRTLLFTLTNIPT